ncbi:MAG: hypothetical protein ACPG7F_01155 [Aggregatilineales bacterium]
MTNFAFQIDVPPALFADVLEAIDRAPKTMNTFIEQSLKPDMARRVLPQLQVDPPRPRYPLRWKSPKQRRYVMMILRKRATNKDDIRYRRTGRLIAGWDVETETDNQGGLIAVTHPWDGVEYVVGGGSRRQPMFPHWYNLDDILLEEQARAEDALTDTWFTILDAKPGTFA